jgi:hypothetical protein
MDERTISAEESIAFRRMRIVWLGLFSAAVLLFVIAPQSLWLWPAIAFYFGVVVYVVFWPCPLEVAAAA